MKKILLVSFLAGVISGGIYLVSQPKAECNSCGYCSPSYDGCYTNCACLIPKIGGQGKCVSTRRY